MAVMGIASAVALVGIPAHAGTSPKPALDNHSVPPPAGIPGSWRLVLDSEFDGARLPDRWLAGWQRRGVTAPVNRSEPDCYSPANVSLPGDGTLHLSVTAQPSRCAGVVKPFTGAIVTTNPAHRGVGGGFTYTFGVLQARVYVPGNGAGIVDWPAVWTDGRSWPRDGEDDVMEGLNGVACFHFDDPSGRHGGCDPELTPGWHTFASDWEPARVVYYYDGARVGSVALGVTAAPMYIVIDNTVSARPGAKAVEAAVRVQYVRVWQRR